jgi:hypothetical protein
MTAVADFDGDGLQDLASINWGQKDDSSVVVHYQAAPSEPDHISEL